MTLQDLKAEFLARHAVSLDDSAREFVHRFVAFVEAELAAVAAALHRAYSLGWVCATVAAAARWSSSTSARDASTVRPSLASLHR